MTTSPFAHLLEARYNFLEPSREEMRKLFPQGRRILPTPYPIFHEDEAARPFYGFPVLLTSAMDALDEALGGYIAAEEGAQLSVLRREPFPRVAYTTAWNRYRALLLRTVENATMASYGRRFPAVFWLFHSRTVARLLKETPKRLLRADLEFGRRHGDRIKYRVFQRYSEQVREAVLGAVQQLATDAEGDGDEEGLFPHLLKRMFDNVLIFTEDHVSSDLIELGPYLGGGLQIDARALKRRFATLVEWHARALAEDGGLRAVVDHLLGDPAAALPRRLLNRPGYVRWLATRPGYDPATLLSPELVEVWEALLVKLKEFELLHALRALVLPVRREGERLVFRAGGLDRTWVGQRLIALSGSTRPLDFMSPAVIDPLVHRFGLIYDLSEFSSTISHLHRAGSELQESAFRSMFRFQRRVNRLAGTYRMQLEKYLGDGAFYTSRHPLSVLLCAIHLQRLYRHALAEGLPFDRGLRLGLNFSRYRLLPIQTGREDEGDRYEFFGHGVVELSRLTSGKSSLEIEEIKNILVNHGYPRQAVLRFFEPLAERNFDVIEKEDEQRPFYAYINRNRTLINEGIVATEELIAEIDQALRGIQLYRGRQGLRDYVVVPVADSEGRLYVGMRRLGMARLKGLDDLVVYEIIDGSDLHGSLGDLGTGRLLAALERLAAAGMTRQAVSE